MVEGRVPSGGAYVTVHAITINRVNSTRRPRARARWNAWRRKGKGKERKARKVKAHLNPSVDSAQSDPSQATALIPAVPRSLSPRLDPLFFLSWHTPTVHTHTPCSNPYRCHRSPIPTSFLRVGSRCAVSSSRDQFPSSSARQTKITTWHVTVHAPAPCRSVHARPVSSTIPSLVHSFSFSFARTCFPSFRFFVLIRD